MEQAALDGGPRHTVQLAQGDHPGVGPIQIGVVQVGGDLDGFLQRSTCFACST
ncbi:hypothetical protein ACFQ60_43290 [Streptomyces zhihengii]